MINKNDIIKTLKYENLSIEEIAELNWLLNADYYKERPVTIEEFYSSTDFVKKKWPNIYPLWKQTLHELYPTPFNAPYNEVLISAAAGGGKCLGYNTPILMYDGTIKMVQDIQVGDKLMGPDDLPRYVRKLCTGTELMYKVILQDGTSFICNKSHILSLRHRSTLEIANFNIEEFINRKELHDEYFAYKYHDPILYKFVIEKLEEDRYYGFTIGYNENHISVPDESIEFGEDWQHLFVLGNNIVTHNTTTATIGVLYDMYKLACLKDPCRFYGLTPDTMLIFAVFSATGSTAAVNWQDITTGIESCPWMMDKLVDKRGLEKKNGSLVPVEILPGIFIQTGSKFQHSMGKAIFDGLMDEAAFGGSNLKDAQKTYNELSSRMATRFRSYSKTGNLPGHLFLVSSPKEAGDFMQYRVEIAEKTNSKFTLVKKNISSWDANPSNDSDEKFTVFIGNETAEPKIFEEGEIPSIDDMDYLIYPPMSYYEEFKKDILGSIMNYGGITAMTDMALFKSATALNNCFVLTNPFKQDVIQLPFAKHDKQIMDFIDMDYFRDIRHPEYNRFIHIDAAFSANTIDVYGLAAGYCIFTDNNNGLGAESEDAFEKRDRMYFIDFSIGIDAVQGQEVPLYKVQDFIEYLVKKLHYPVACVSADTFQSKQTLQNLDALAGINTENITVDRTRDPYLFLRQLVTNKQILLPKNEYLKAEMRKLRDDGKKVDHPINCFTEDTKIALVDGRSLTIRELLKEQEYKQNWVYTFNEQTQKIEPKPIKNVFQTKITKQLIEVTLDNGEIITCTPEHRFMLRDGSYEEAQNLTSGTSLMPLYTKISEKGNPGYRMYYEPMEDCWHYEHRQFGNPTKLKNIIHHCNYNKLDNCPNNLKAVTRSEHASIHNNSTLDYSKTAKSVAKYHERMRGTEEYKERSRKLSEKARKQQEQIWNSLPKEVRKAKLDKKLKKEQYIKEIEEMFNVDYSILNRSQKRSYAGKYFNAKNPEKRKEISNKVSKAHKEGKYKKIQEVIRTKRWITNGIENKYIGKTENIPEGFRPGRTLSQETIEKMRMANSHVGWSPERLAEYSKKHSENTSNRIWVTNGKIDKYILKTNEIPEGFKPGRSKVGKNHKVVSIKHITKPSRVYDLEIRDNHNFALAAGVFVHNCHKDLADAVAGCIWSCANSNKILNSTRIAHKVLNPYGEQAYSPEKAKAVELQEFERMKQQFSSSIFKHL